MERGQVAPASCPTRPHRAGWGFRIGVGVLALGLFAGLSGYLRSLERAALSGGVSDDPDAGRTRTIAKVRQMVGAMKLLTVELLTTVNYTAGDESWRGDVSATVEAPVKLHFGTDLARARVEWGAIGPATRVVRITAPVPERLATEVVGEAEAVNVSVGWLRFRSRAGEYYLGLARKGIYDAARRMTLSEKDAADVRELTRRKLADAARLMAPDEGLDFRIAFADE